MTGLPPGECEAKVGMRAARRDVLIRQQALEFEAIILEHVLLDPVCEPEFHDDQLRHLLRMSELPNVTIRVIPSGTHRWNPMHSGHFVLFEFGTAAPIVHLNARLRGVPLRPDCSEHLFSSDRYSPKGGDDQGRNSRVHRRVHRKDRGGPMTGCPTSWRKSRYSSQQTACVEVGRVADGAAVRDTKNRAAGHLTATAGQWSAFIDAVKAGKFSI
jgi:hypothetical protein